MTTSKNNTALTLASTVTADSTDKLIKSAILAAQTMTKKVQQAAVSILIHTFKTGDYRKANDLVNGLGNGVNNSTLVEWFKLMGLEATGDEKDGFTGYNKQHIKDCFDGKITRMVNKKEVVCIPNEVMWTSVKLAKPFGGFDLKVVLEKVVTQHGKAVTAANKEDDVEAALKLIDADPRVIEALAKIIASM